MVKMIISFGNSSIHYISKDFYGNFCSWLRSHTFGIEKGLQGLQKTVISSASTVLAKSPRREAASHALELKKDFIPVGDPGLAVVVLPKLNLDFLSAGFNI